MAKSCVRPHHAGHSISTDFSISSRVNPRIAAVTPLKLHSYVAAVSRPQFLGASLLHTKTHLEIKPQICANFISFYTSTHLFHLFLLWPLWEIKLGIWGKTSCSKTNSVGFNRELREKRLFLKKNFRKLIYFTCTTLKHCMKLLHLVLSLKLKLDKDNIYFILITTELLLLWFSYSIYIC